jgi:hypothetical protein
MMIGGIEVFLPSAQEEAEKCVADDAATEIEEQSVVTVQGELEQMAKTAQAEMKEENERSEEQLNSFSQRAESAVALELTAEEAKEQAGRFITPWEMELEMLEDWLNNPEPARELAEIELSEKVAEQKVSQEETAELKSAAEWQLEATDEEEGMGDHGDLPMCQKILQLGRLHDPSQPWEQLDEVIEDIRRLMLRSAETASEERLGRRKEAAAAVQKQQQQQNGADGQLHRFVWDPGGFQQLEGKRMSRSS